MRTARAVRLSAGQYFDVWNPSNGQLIARAPQCTSGEVELAVQSAREAFSFVG